MSWKAKDWGTFIGSLFAPGAGTLVGRAIGTAADDFTSAARRMQSSIGLYGTNDQEVYRNLLAEIKNERDWNSAEAQKNRDFQERMARNQTQYAVEDITKAGLNPWLAVQGAGALSAGSVSGDSASSSGSSALAQLSGQLVNANTNLARAVISAVTSAFGSAAKIMAAGAGK